MSVISVLGSGGWGIALACTLANNGHKVNLWSVFQDEVDLLKRERCNEKLLKGVVIPDSINITGDVSVVKDSDIVILAVPSFAVRQTAHSIADLVKDNAIVVNVSKGFEKDTLKCMSEVIAEELPNVRVVVLSGPSHAEEVACSVPTSIVSASEDAEAAALVQETFSCSALRVYTNDDVVGVEVGGALKNVIALSAGICDGLKLGDNTKAALMTRGLSEIARLGVAMGARAETFSGLTGIGDLIVTCMSMHSRNRRFGILIGEGVAPSEAMDRIGMMVEGYHACLISYDLAKKYKVDMPICTQCYNILSANVKPEEALRNLMERPKKNETENLFIR